MLAMLRGLTPRERRVSASGQRSLDHSDQPFCAYAPLNILTLWSLSTGGAGATAAITCVACGQR